MSDESIDVDHMAAHLNELMAVDTDSVVSAMMTPYPCARAMLEHPHVFAREGAGTKDVAGAQPHITPLGIINGIMARDGSRNRLAASVTPDGKVVRFHTVVASDPRRHI